MRHKGFVHVLTVLSIVLCLPMIADAATTNLFFLHHSTGRNLVTEGTFRSMLSDYNLSEGKSLEFWDHDYNYIGVKGPDGVLLGYDYDIPGDNTYPDGLHELWTTENSARAQILANHQLIAFKSCFPTSDITSESVLEQYKQYYWDIRDAFDTFAVLHPDKIFVVMSPPPLHRLATTPEIADRARTFADWLKSDEFLAGHDNIVCFDLFDQLAKPDDGTDTRNMLKYEYEVAHGSSDSHPNTLANQTVCPVFFDFMVQTAAASDASAVTVPGPGPRLLQNVPNPFNPLTRIAFKLPDRMAVRLGVFDMRGRSVRLLVDETLDGGEHVRDWNGRDDFGNPVGSGVYIYRLSTESVTTARKLMLTR